MLESKLNLNDKAEITLSGESGVITAVCQYISSETQYELLYCEKGTGRAVHDWWSESLLRHVLPSDNTRAES